MGVSSCSCSSALTIEQNYDMVTCWSCGRIKDGPQHVIDRMHEGLNEARADGRRDGAQAMLEDIVKKLRDRANKERDLAEGWEPHHGIARELRVLARGLDVAADWIEGGCK